MIAAMRFSLFAAFAVTATTLFGCDSGRPKCYLAGKATYQGRPVSEYHVVFYSPTTGGGASGILDDAGTFRVDGAVEPGDYVVSLVLPAPPPSAAMNPKPAPRKSAVIIPQKYQRESTTDLKVTVVAGQNHFDFDLKPDGASESR